MKKPSAPLTAVSVLPEASGEAQELPLTPPGGGPPAAGWRKYFAEHSPGLSPVRKLVLKLHDEKRYPEVIAVIEAALLNGQTQPWMYEVLASTMKAAGRPDRDIQRVLLSAVDFSATDIPDILFAAAYMTRFGQDQRALELYREAARFAPQRPEPYVLGLKLARSAKDVEAVAWAASGILTQAWGKDYVQLHRQADEAAAEAEGWLQKSPDAAKLKTLRERLAAARQRDLVVKLTWNGDADLDLIVEEPLGSVCSFETPYSQGGGILAHDGQGPKPENAYELYVCPQGATGKYRLTVRVLSGKVVAKQALLTITRHQGTPQEAKTTAAVPLTGQDTTVTLQLENGRRTELLPALAMQELRLPAGRVAQLGALPQGQNRVQLAAHTAESRELREKLRQQRGVLFQQLTAAGNRAAAQPVVQFLNDGVSQTATAVVSADRRYVRLSLSPTFSAITDVFTFTYSGGQPAAGNGGR